MKNNNFLAYRSDIDGLRAVAVLSVLLFHIDKNLVPGGYAGVDIFFVISGYLITLLIQTQIERGTFSFTDFYRRRINRIAPALFGVIAATGLTGLIVLAPFDLIRLMKSSVYAALGLSNVFFWRTYGDYFSSGVGEAPLLHTWSLGVEEQFYIVWPVALILLSRLKPKFKWVAVGVSLLAAIAVSEVGVRTIVSASYYLLPTRFFELLIGSALALFISYRGKDFGRNFSALMGCAGALLTLGSMILLTSEDAFPGVNAVYPCVGAALLIAAGVRRDTWTARVLGFRPLMYIGLISYSLYLWHWPIIAFIHYRGIPIDFSVGMSIFFGSMLCGWLSWRYVETPFRRSGTTLSFFSIFGWRYVIPMATIAIVSYAILAMDGLPNRFDPRVTQYEKIIATVASEIRSNCHAPNKLYLRRPDPRCVLGVASKPAEALLIGDSFANHFTGMIDVLAKQDGLTVADYTMDGCMPIKDMGFGAIKAFAEKCKLRNEINYQLVAHQHFKYVILAGKWPNEGGGEYFAKLGIGFDKSIASILAAGSTPIVILNTQGTDNASCSIRRLITASSASCDRVRESNVAQRAMFAELSLKYPQLSFLDPNAVVCENNVCHSTVDAIPLFRDSEHLNDVGSRLVGQLLLAKGVHLIPAPLSVSNKADGQHGSL